MRFGQASAASAASSALRVNTSGAAPPKVAIEQPLLLLGDIL